MVVRNRRGRLIQYGSQPTSWTAKQSGFNSGQDYLSTRTSRLIIGLAQPSIQYVPRVMGIKADVA
jgi:hypothetical protein